MTYYLIYPEHTIALQAKKLAEEADGYKNASIELQRGLDTLTKTTVMSDVQKELADTVRRMAIVQVGLGLVVKGLLCLY